MSAARLRLRPLAAADAAEVAEAAAASRELLRRRLGWGDGAPGACAGREDLGIFEARGGRLAGVASLSVPPAVPGLAEFSLWIRADLQGQGYGAEAGRLLAAHAFRSEEIQKLYARLDPANRAARKVLQRAGFRYEGCLRREKRLNGRWIDQECWGLLRSEWRNT